MARGTTEETVLVVIRAAQMYGTGRSVHHATYAVDSNDCSRMGPGGTRGELLCAKRLS